MAILGLGSPQKKDAERPAFKSKRPEKSLSYPKRRLPLVLIASTLIHATAFLFLSHRPKNVRQEQVEARAKKNYTKLILDPRAQNKESAENTKRILETPMLPTEAPKTFDRLANADHKAEKSTKIPESLQVFKGKPGLKGNLGKQKETTEKQANNKSNSTKVTEKIQEISDASAPKKLKKIESYADLLPRATAGLAAGELDGGYSDIIKEDLPIGDRIDMNTSEYRFIGYFSQMRQAIENVWNYPREAQIKSLQGEVGLEFSILEDGHASQIKVLKSSGYSVLDEAIVKAIHDASPFAPLPKNIGREKLVVTGSFRYILSGYAH